MLYIEKIGLPKDISGKIIELSKSDDWKNIDENDTSAIREFFDGYFPKNDIKEILLHEQHGICAYCMKRIRMDNHSRVEHFIPLSRNKDKAIDYSNMLGVCDGGEKALGNQGHVLCCDAHKKKQKSQRIRLIRCRWIKLHIIQKEKSIQSREMRLWRGI